MGCGGVDQVDQLDHHETIIVFNDHITREKGQGFTQLSSRLTFSHGNDLSGMATTLTSSSPATETAVLTESRLWLRLLVSMVRVKAMAESGVTVAWRGLNFAFYPLPWCRCLVGRAAINWSRPSHGELQVPWQRRPARHPHQCARARAGGGEWQRGGGEPPHHTCTNSLGFIGKNVEGGGRCGMVWCGCPPGCGA